jgi:hypothetical protein
LPLLVFFYIKLYVFFFCMSNTGQKPSQAIFA